MIPFLDQMMDFVEDLSGVSQPIKYHPEGDALTHTLQVLKIAFRESNDIDLLLSALLHDIGKKENSHGHEQIAVSWLKLICSEKTLWIIDNHIRIRYYIDGELRQKNKREKLLNNPWFKDVVILSRWDTMGRNPNLNVMYNRQKIMDTLNKIYEVQLC